MRDTLLLALAASLSVAGAAVAASPADGTWLTPVHRGTIEIYDCGAATICGRVANSDLLRANPDMRDARNGDAALQTRRIKGLVMMSEFHGGPSEWTGGKLYNPDDGHTYHGTITMKDANTLALKGCVIAPFCQTQTWTRVH